MSHSTILGGSNAERVLNCPASVKLSADLPDPPPSSYALEGTMLHSIMEQALDTDKEPTLELIGTTLLGVEVTAELFADKIIPAQEATLEAFKRFEVEWVCAEARVQYTPIEGSFGTCDILAGGRDDLIVLLDYKFGHNIVSPVKNRQLMFYAIAAMHDPEYKNDWTGEPSQPVVLGIIQPTNESRDSALWTWETTAGELAEFDMNLRQSVEIALNQESKPIVGDWCRYCKAAAICPAKLRGAAAVNSLKQEHLNDLSVALALAGELEPWIKSVKTMAHEQLERGDQIEGWKLVAKRAMRKWKDVDEATIKLKNAKKLVAADYSVIKILSPTQLESICKAKGVDFKRYADYIESVSSGTTMAPEDDKRPAIIIELGDDIPEAMK